MILRSGLPLIQTRILSSASCVSPPGARLLLHRRPAHSTLTLCRARGFHREHITWLADTGFPIASAGDERRMVAKQIKNPMSRARPKASASPSLNGASRSAAGCARLLRVAVGIKLTPSVGALAPSCGVSGRVYLVFRLEFVPTKNRRVFNRRRNALIQSFCSELACPRSRAKQPPSFSVRSAHGPSTANVAVHLSFNLRCRSLVYIHSTAAAPPAQWGWQDASKIAASHLWPWKRQGFQNTSNPAKHQSQDGFCAFLEPLIKADLAV
ncbi:uncharacterized protein VTP21DRAFT_3891 [Calcarisporiella thermophila]|uniref:uncharacterized protein n=1 Tax=Calcarisporiella thermophila TaxID=911321 RepID=UPI0037438EE8